MLLLEAPRFADYFEREYMDQPVLVQGADYLRETGEKSVSPFMAEVARFNTELSEKFTISFDRPIKEQAEEAYSFYTQAFLQGINVPLKDSFLIDEENTQVAQNAILEKSQESPLKEDENKGHAPTDNTVADNTASVKTSEVKPEVITDTAVETNPTESNSPETNPVGTTETPVTPEANPQISQESIVAENTTDTTSVIASTSTTDTTGAKDDISYSFFDAQNVLLPEDNNSHALAFYKTNLPDYGKKLNVLIVGDSMMMEGLGPTLQKALGKFSDLNVVRQGRYSSGLSRPDFYDWPQNIQRLIKEHNPHMIIVSLGANDTQDIVVNKKRHFIDSKSWERVYAIRALNFLETTIGDDREILWVSLPIMIKMPYAKRTKIISKIQAEVSSYYENVEFLNIEHLLTKNGAFTAHIMGENNKTIRLRSKDNIHVSTEGGHILTSYVLPHAQKQLNQLRLAELEKKSEKLALPVAGMANRVTFTSELRKKEVEYYVFLPQTARLETDETPLDWATYQDQNKILTLADLPQNIQNIQNINRQTLEQGQMSIPDVVSHSLLNGSAEKEGQAKQEKIRFPVLYLLHGAYDDGKIWNDKMGAELQKIADEKQVIIVCPSSEPFGWYVDSPLVAQNQIESFFMEELLPHVDMLYPTNKKRAVAGISMGGHGAMLYGFKHPKTFASVASLSGVLDIRDHATQWKIKDLLGTIETNKKNWDENSVQAFIDAKWPKYAPKQILIRTGLQDVLVLEDNKKAVESLKTRKYTFDYQEFDGNHDWNFWTEHMPILLRQQADFLNNL